MRIALFSDSFDQINGVSKTLKRIVQFAGDTGFKLDVHTYDVGESTCEQSDFVRIFRYKPILPIHYYSDMFWDAPTIRRKLLWRCAGQDYSLIHVATPGSMGLNALLVAHRLQRPLIGTYHTAVPEYTQPRVAKFCDRMGLGKLALGDKAERAMWKYISWFYGHCRLVLAPSYSVKVQLEQHIRPRVSIFSRGIETDIYHPRFRQEPPRFTALYVGRVSVEKNLQMLAEVAKNRPHIRFVVVGDGPYKKTMQQMLPNAEFPGFVTGEPLSRIYASADAFLFPSQTDTFGNVVLEAMSSGLPVIVSDRMGPAELVSNGETGFVAADANAFGERLDFLYNKPAARKVMGQNARAFAVSRNWDSVLAKLFEDYNTVLRESAATVSHPARAVSPGKI